MYFVFGGYLVMTLGNEEFSFKTSHLSDLIYRNHLLIPINFVPGQMLDCLDDFLDDKNRLSKDKLWLATENSAGKVQSSTKIGSVLTPCGAIRNLNAVDYKPGNQTTVRYTSERMFLPAHGIALSWTFKDMGIATAYALAEGKPPTMDSCLYICEGLMKQSQTFHGCVIIEIESMCKHLRGEIPFSEVKYHDMARSIASKAVSKIIPMNSRMNKPSSKPRTINIIGGSK